MSAHDTTPETTDANGNAGPAVGSILALLVFFLAVITFAATYLYTRLGLTGLLTVGGLAILVGTTLTWATLRARD